MTPPLFYPTPASHRIRPFQAILSVGLPLALTGVALFGISSMAIVYAQPVPSADPSTAQSAQSAQSADGAAQSADGSVKKDGVTSNTVDTQASQPVVSDIYRVQINQPNARWRLLSRDRARRLSPLAIGGAIDPGRSFGLVLIESVASLKLEEYAQALMDHSPLKEVLVEEALEVKYQGHDAIKLTYSGDTQGARYRYVSYVFFKERYAYQVSAGGAVGMTDLEALEAFAQAVIILSGPVKSMSADQTRVEDQVGIGWRVERGAFEGVYPPVRITPPKGWRLVVGDELKLISAEAVVGLARVNPEVWVVISQHPCPAPEADRCARWLRTALEETFELKPLTDALSFKLFQRDEDFFRYLHSSGTFSYLHHLQLDQLGQATQVMAWTLKGQEERAWSALPEALSALKKLTSPELKALESQLKSDEQNRRTGFERGDRVRRDERWVDGVYRHHLLHVLWKKPEGLWRVNLTSPEGHEVSVLEIEAPRDGLFSQIRFSKARAPSLKTGHRVMWDALMRDLSTQTPKNSKLKVSAGEAPLMGGQGLWSEVTFGRDRPILYRLHSAIEDGIAVHVLSWSPAPIFNRAALNTVISTLEVSPHERAIHFDGARFEDRRARFALENLPSGATLDWAPEVGVGSTSSGVSLYTAEVTLGALAVAQGRSSSPKSMLDAISERVVARFGLKGPPEVREVHVDGASATLLKWRLPMKEGDTPQAFALYLIDRAPMMYGYFVFAPPESPYITEGAQRFKLLSP